MKRLLSQFVPTVRREKFTNLRGYAFFFPLSPPRAKYRDIKRQTICTCGKGGLCLQNCFALSLWMSGQRCPESLEKSFVHISKRSFAVGVRAFGFSIKVFLHILRGVTT